MKYHYFYQSRENKTCDDWIEAKNRNDAYALLRKRGIKPFKVLGRNPYAWKRWTAIGVLAALVAVLALVVVRGVAKNRREAYEAAFATEERAQIYGDSAILHDLASDGWRKAMGSEGDAWLARHAIPGRLCDCSTPNSHPSPNSQFPTPNSHLSTNSQFPIPNSHPTRISPDDSPEVAKMKSIVNCMKRELSDYLAAGGTTEDYMTLCDERLRTERDILSNVTQELKTLETRMTPENYDETSAVWSKKNATLRSLGLPTIVMPDDPRESR